LQASNIFKEYFIIFIFVCLHAAVSWERISHVVVCLQRIYILWYLVSLRYSQRVYIMFKYPCFYPLMLITA
jgi:hypothetical protein